MCLSWLNDSFICTTFGLESGHFSIFFFFTGVLSKHKFFFQVFQNWRSCKKSFYLKWCFGLKSQRLSLAHIPGRWAAGPAQCPRETGTRARWSRPLIRCCRIRRRKEHPRPYIEWYFLEIQQDFLGFFRVCFW